MKFHVGLPGLHHIPPANDHVPEAPHWTFTLTPPDYQRLAAVIDELGYDVIAAPEHFAMPYEEVPRLGPFWMHALSVMAFVAGVTERARIDQTGIGLPHHQPLALA